MRLLLTAQGPITDRFELARRRADLLLERRQRIAGCVVSA
jgi:hypothetical protein